MRNIGTSESLKAVYSAADIAADLSIGEEEAKYLLTELNHRIENLGGISFRDKRVSRYFYERMKETGFTSPEGRTPCLRLDEKRLLDIGEFCFYTGLGETVAREFAKEIKIEKRIGRRTLFDRVLFDQWCDSNNEALQPSSRNTRKEMAGKRKRACRSK